MHIWGVKAWKLRPSFSVPSAKHGYASFAAKSGTEKVLAAKLFWTSNWWAGLSRTRIQFPCAQFAAHESKRIKDVTIWLVVSVSMNFAGLAVKVPLRLTITLEAMAVEWEWMMTEWKQTQGRITKINLSFRFAKNMAKKSESISCAFRYYRSF